MTRSIGTLVVGSVIVAALAQTSFSKESPDNTVKFACVVFENKGPPTAFEGRIPHAQFIKWFREDFRVGGERIETPEGARPFGVLVLTDGKDILVMPLYAWAKGKAKLFSCQSIAIGKAPMFSVVAESQTELLATMKTRFGELSKMSQKPTADDHRVNSIIEDIRTGNIAARIAAAESLPAALAEYPDRKSLKYVVPKLTPFLRDDNDTIRYWVAMSLGKLGQEASEAIPALIVALTDRVNDHSSKSSESGIRHALHEIEPNWLSRTDIPQSVRDRWGKR